MHDYLLNMWPAIFFTCLFSFTLILKTINCSKGEKLPEFQMCVVHCENNHCKPDNSKYLPYNKLDWMTKLLWNCTENCEYDCMWHAVEWCTYNEIDIPKFRGKWPFIRFFGIQEPASTLFSIGNLLCGLLMFKKSWRKFHFPYDMRVVWTVNAWANANAWICSTFFHTRDMPFIEILDYIGAFTLVHFTFSAFGYRILYFCKWWYRAFFITSCLICYCCHTYCLWSYKHDYQYNTTTVIILGGIASVTVLTWSYWMYKEMPHVKYAALYVALTAAAASFEIVEISPWFWIFDSHSVWHFATIPLPIFLYKFIIEDCMYLRYAYRSKFD